MKHLFILVFVLLNVQLKADTLLPKIPVKRQVVEASCGQCNFKLPGKGCALAVRINGVAYFVDGTGIDDHGDAHAADGFCKAIKRAEVKGKIVNGRFKAKYFKLIV